MNAMPDLATYQDPEVLTPPDEPEDCPDCGRYYCTPDCRPSFVSPYRARFRERLENGDPES